MADRPITNAWVARNFERRPGDSQYGGNAASAADAGLSAPTCDDEASLDLPTPRPVRSDGRRLFSECASAPFAETSIASLQSVTGN